MWPKYALKEYYFKDKKTPEILLSHNQRQALIQYIRGESQMFLQRIKGGETLDGRAVVEQATKIAETYIRDNKSTMQSSQENIRNVRVRGDFKHAFRKPHILDHDVIRIGDAID